jgi:hypothetical protein
MAWILWTLPVFKIFLKKKKKKGGFLGVYFWRFDFQKTEEKRRI